MEEEESKNTRNYIIIALIFVIGALGYQVYFYKPVEIEEVKDVEVIEEEVPVIADVPVSTQPTEQVEITPTEQLGATRTLEIPNQDELEAYSRKIQAGDEFGFTLEENYQNIDGKFYTVYEIKDGTKVIDSLRSEFEKATELNRLEAIKNYYYSLIEEVDSLKAEVDKL